MTEDRFFDGVCVHKNQGGLLGVALLAIFLCISFFLAITAYGMFSSNEESGELAGAVAVLRELVTENDTVAVFLGFSSDDNDSIAVGGNIDADGDAAYREAILRAAEEYIRQHES